MSDIIATVSDVQQRYVGEQNIEMFTTIYKKNRHLWCQNPQAETQFLCGKSPIKLEDDACNFWRRYLMHNAMTYNLQVIVWKF